MGSYHEAVRAGLVTFALAALLYSPRISAQAQADLNTPTPQTKEMEESTNDGWHFAFTPYIWFSGVHGEAGALGHDVSVHASFGDIFNYLNFGAMGMFETSYKRVLMPVDFMWMKLSDEKGVPITDDVDSVKATMRETMLTPKIGYRIADGKKVKVDALFGVRYWHLNNELRAFTQGAQIGKTISQSANWADAVAGGRIELALSPKAFVAIAGDAGGGSAKSDWQVGGGLGYKVSRKWVMLVGYRYLSIDYRPNGNAQFVYDVNMPGLILGATYNFK
jgi:opacity protein-like surface antigen